MGESVESIARRIAQGIEETAKNGASAEFIGYRVEVAIRRALEGARVREDEIRRDEREACAKIARDAALNARLMVDRKEARTLGGTAVLTGYVFAATEAETIAKLITARRVQACLESGDA